MTPEQIIDAVADKCKWAISSPAGRIRAVGEHYGCCPIEVYIQARPSMFNINDLAEESGLSLDATKELVLASDMEIPRTHQLVTLRERMLDKFSFVDGRYREI